MLEDDIKEALNDYIEERKKEQEYNHTIIGGIPDPPEEDTIEAQLNRLKGITPQ